MEGVEEGRGRERVDRGSRRRKVGGGREKEGTGLREHESKVRERKKGGDKGSENEKDRSITGQEEEGNMNTNTIEATRRTDHEKRRSKKRLLATLLDFPRSK